MIGFAGLGHFGGGAERALSPIAFAPNPVECLWIGPLVSDFNCSTCVIGYETNSTDDTCVKPEFRPYRGWNTSVNRNRLQIQDVDNSTTVQLDNETNTPILLTEHTYMIPAPLLEPKERKVCSSLLNFLLFNVHPDIGKVLCYC